VARRLAFSRRALLDLDDIRAWLTQQGSGVAARRRLQAVYSVIRRLRQSPCLYPVGAQPGVREAPCEGGYRVSCELHPDTGFSATAGDVVILRVFGPGQDRGGLSA
jgi:plasmid stabilization system protein ParE